MKLAENYGKVGEKSSHFEKRLVSVQLYNAVILHDSLPACNCTND